MKYVEHQIAAILRISVRQAGTGRQRFNLHRRGTALQVNWTAWIAWYKTVSETSISYTVFSGHKCNSLTSLFRNFGLHLPLLPAAHRILLPLTSPLLYLTQGWLLMSNGLCVEISYFLPRLSYTWAKDEMSLPHPWLGLVYFAFCVPQITEPNASQQGPA